MITQPSHIRSIVFDLDGTLYTSPGMAREIESAAEQLVSASRGIGRDEGKKLLRAARSRLAETYEEEPTLTRTLLELGIEVREFHEAMQARVRPEKYIENDPILYALLDSLREVCELYVYTNNNLFLTQKILSLLGVEDIFQRLYTIEFSWTPKPDPDTFNRMVEDIGGPPESFLFIGDRPQVDLKLAESQGFATLTVSETGDLLQVHQMLGIVP